MMPRRSLLVAAGWLATAAVATLIGLGAIRLVGESIAGTPGGVRSQEEIARALAAEPSSPAGPSPSAAPATGVPSAGASPTAASPTAASPTAGSRRSFGNDGGTVVAECTADGVRLVSWAPAQGYRVHDVDRGPDDDVEIRFEGSAGEHELKLRCVGGQPVVVKNE